MKTYPLQFVLVSFAVQLKRKAIHGRHASVLSLFCVEEVQKHQCTVVGGIITVHSRQETGSGGGCLRPHSSQTRLLFGSCNVFSSGSHSMLENQSMYTRYSQLSSQSRHFKAVWRKKCDLYFLTHAQSMCTRHHLNLLLPADR